MGVGSSPTYVIAVVAELVYAPVLETGPLGWGFESLRRHVWVKEQIP